MGMLGVALLLVMAVAGPGCLLFASTAMAMPSHEAPVSDCGDSEGGSMTACPHEQPLESGTQNGASTLQQYEQPTTAEAIVPDTSQVEVGRVIATQASRPEAPIDHLTPLRL